MKGVKNNTVNIYPGFKNIDDLVNDDPEEKFDNKGIDEEYYDYDEEELLDDEEDNYD